MESLFDMLVRQGYIKGERVHMCKSCKERFGKFDSTTFLGDTGASTHMVPTDEGMYDCEEINEPVIIGDGKPMRAVKKGKLRRTVLQVDGTTRDVVR